MRKTCPRCLGRLHGQADQFGNYESCLQCGYQGQTSPGPGKKAAERLHLPPSVPKPVPRPVSGDDADLMKSLSAAFPTHEHWLAWKRDMEKRLEKESYCD